MALSAAFEDSASISTTEYSLPADTTSGVPTSQTDDGIYQAFIDFANMVAGDQYRVKVYEKIQSAGSQRTLLSVTLTGAQSHPLVLPSLMLLHGWDITVQRIAGSDRTIGWSIRKVA